MRRAILEVSGELTLIDDEIPPDDDWFRAAHEFLRHTGLALTDVDLIVCYDEDDY